MTQSLPFLEPERWGFLFSAHPFMGIIEKAFKMEHTASGLIHDVFGQGYHLKYMTLKNANIEMKETI